MSGWDCGCGQRRGRLNDIYPGLGELVAAIAEPVKAFLVWVWGCFHGGRDG